MLDTKPAAEPLVVPQIVRNLIDHLPQPQRAELDGRRKYIDAQLYWGRDGWLVVRMRDWDRHDVFFKWEMNQLQYQCNCWDFRTQAPVPCSHVALAALKALKNGGLEQPQSLPAAERDTCSSLQPGCRAPSAPPRFVDPAGVPLLLYDPLVLSDPLNATP